MTLSEESEELGAELHDLYRSGAVSIPLIANRFVAANDMINQTQDGSASAFTQISDDVSQVYASWADLRDKMQTYVGKSGENMHDIGLSLIEIMKDYKEVDCAAAKELERLIKENEDYEGDLVNPDDIPEYENPVYPG